VLERDGDVEGGSVEVLRPGSPGLAGGFFVAADMLESEADVIVVVHGCEVWSGKQGLMMARYEFQLP
jgi:hypothetical protein